MRDLPSPAVSLRRVGKRFGDFTAIDDLSFDIADNEFFTLLGPSGCGKTTLLRMIAGFEETSAGEIYLYGEEIEKLPPDKRPINTVFQSYALFPHMTVAENIGFGLKMLSWAEDVARERVAEMVAMVKLDAFAHRRPAQLSGGQQQRVALARAMAPRPKVLLLDEPLSALDLKLRQAMRAELKELQRNTGITFIFVTHDQEEALSMSDRIAVMSAGQVQQIGTPDSIYEAPANRFVADFIGETNLLDATVIHGGDTVVICRVVTGDTLQARVDTPTQSGVTGSLSIRPERLTLLSGDSSVHGQRDDTKVANMPDARNALGARSRQSFLDGTVGESVYLGTDRQISVEVGDGLVLSVRMQNIDSKADIVRSGARVQIAMAEGAARFLCD